MRRLWFGLIVVALVTGFIGTPDASAQQQSVNFFIGGFVPRSPDGRGTDDVLFRNGDFLSFHMRDFDGLTVGGEWLIGITDWFDAGLGGSFYQQTVHAVYTDLINDNGSEIRQQLKLRIAPFTATMRFLPLGHRGLVRPYIGGGVGIFNWRYSESGEFVANDNTIYRDTFVGTGSDVGPVILGGLTFPIGIVDMGGEIRYQSAKGTLPQDIFGYPGNPRPKIDLGGMNYLFVVNFRF